MFSCTDLFITALNLVFVAWNLFSYSPILIFSAFGAITIKMREDLHLPSNPSQGIAR